MAEYIDREKAIEIIKSGGYWEREDMEVAIACIEQTPTADVVDVVRCKDCKYAKNSKTVLGVPDYSCLKTALTCLDADDFCSYGKKEDKE